MEFEEVPTTNLITDPDLLAFFEYRVERTASEFGLDRSGWPSQVVLHWRDGRPSRSIIPGDPSGCLIHLSQGADEFQARYQLAHEVTHAVLCPDHTAFDWVEEMFAVHVSVRALFEMGATDYAEIALEQLAREAQEVTLGTEELLEADLEAFCPAEIYPKAFGIGVEFIQAIGWANLKPLGCMFRADGKHDVHSWLANLSASERISAQRILGM